MRTDIKDAISNLIGALLIHRVAKRLRSKDTGGAVDRELASLYIRIGAGNLGITPFVPLVEAVIHKASDIEIWKLVLQLIVSASRITPPPSKPSYKGTPRTYNSASHQGLEQNKKLLEDGLRDELWDCSFIKVPGFFEKYFDGKSWTQQGKDIFNAIKHTHMDGRWNSFPNPPTESAVWQWWSAFQNEHLADLSRLYYATKDKNDMTGIDTEAQLDLLIKSRNKSSSDPHDWADVCVVGEHTLSKNGYKFLQLARYARNVFITQPRRYFLHSFTLCATSMELHIFDRSGVYSAEPFDIHKDPERFIRTISGYCLMSDEELGLDMFVECDGTKEFVTIKDNITREDRRLQIETHPIALQRAIACRGTSCFPTTDHKNVVKFSWIPTSRWLTEPNLLKIAQKKNVKGVARLLGYKRIISTGKLRDGLTFSRPRRLQSRTQKSGVSFSGSRLVTMPPSNTEIVEKKRKSEDLGEGSSAKKSRSNSQTLRLNEVYEAGDCFNNSQPPQPPQPPQPSQPSQAVQPANNCFINRVFSCLAVSPAGRPLDKYNSIKELLCCFRDAIKAHRSLFMDGKILHRDISLNNIIITDPKDANGFTGMLIDLDLATSIDISGKNKRSGARKMTGTLKYMAIEVVEFAFRDAQRDLEHTYRHDLESFFYVFLDICINCGRADDPKQRKDALRAWYIGSYEDITLTKRGGMGKSGFESYFLTKFSPTFDILKNLACVLRNTLFQQGDIYTGTPKNSSLLYKRMIKAFDDGVSEELKREQKTRTRERVKTSVKSQNKRKEPEQKPPWK